MFGFYSFTVGNSECSRENTTIPAVPLLLTATVMSVVWYSVKASVQGGKDVGTFTGVARRMVRSVHQRNIMDGLDANRQRTPERHGFHHGTTHVACKDE